MELHPFDNSEPLNPPFNFTPRLQKLKSRVRMRISAAEHRKVSQRTRGFHGTVTDLDSGKRWDVYGVSCGLPNCNCDAAIYPEGVKP